MSMMRTEKLIKGTYSFKKAVKRGDSLTEILGKIDELPYKTPNQRAYYIGWEAAFEEHLIAETGLDYKYWLAIYHNELVEDKTERLEALSFSDGVYIAETAFYWGKTLTEVKQLYSQIPESGRELALGVKSVIEGINAGKLKLVSLGENPYNYKQCCIIMRSDEK